MGKNTFGTAIGDGATSFRLWSPFHEWIGLKIDGRAAIDMQRDADGWHMATVADAKAGSRYSFVLPDGLEVPDPASRHQPDDVHGPSEVIDPKFPWNEGDWAGRPWEEVVIYELHIGTFTQEGTFLAAIERLDHLQWLGVTAIQIMPISDFPGRWNWGYDGVLPYAPDSSYGRPEDLKRLVDEAHRRGICVFLDVVYNHFGPDGNYLPAYSPIFTGKHRTPWGEGVNYDDEGSDVIRDFVIENAIYWITEFRMDGLRLDAVHAIKDSGQTHVLHEFAERVRASAPDRHIHLIVENEDNDVSLLARGDDAKPKHFTAQWNDDIHHVLHIAATDETFGYYADYTDDPQKIGRALAEGFVFQGEHMPYRGETRGSPSAGLPPTAFISFIQNHDQIGNRALGDRMVATHPEAQLRAIAAIFLLAPQIPMLFMGEEWGARQPFPYFCDFGAELNEAVRKGRKEELSRLPGFDADDAPDPTLESTFRSAKLQWSAAHQNKPTLDFYHKILAIRHAVIVPLLVRADRHGASYSVDKRLIRVTWRLGAEVLELTANLSAEASAETIMHDGDAILRLGVGDNERLGPWAVAWSVDTGGSTL